MLTTSDLGLIPGASHDPVVDRRVTARMGSAMVGAAAILALWAALGGGESPVRPIVFAVSAISLAVAAWACVALPRRPAIFVALAVAATACTTTATVAGPAGADAAPVFYVSITLFAAYFLERRAAFGIVALVVCAYGAGVLAEQPPSALARFVLVTVTVVATAVFVRAIRDRLLRLIVALDRTARTDPLTGAMNRLGLEERLEEELERARRTDLPCAVLVGDLDSFKSFNDRFGHLAGDAVLRLAADVLRSRLRRLDTVGRLGGDEFVVILPGSDRRAADGVVRDLQSALLEHDTGFGEKVAMSFGVAVLPDDGATPGGLVGTADRELLAAKRALRDAYGSSSASSP
jgi:diguanylate cyclase (GGDEF)-like protein